MTRGAQPGGLIAVLLAHTAPFGDRHDAAMDLGGYDDEQAEAALVQVALDPAVDPELADAVGESLWSIWTRQRRDWPEVVARFHPEARKFFAAPRVD